MSNLYNKPLSLLAMTMALTFSHDITASPASIAQPQAKVSQTQADGFYEDDQDFAEVEVAQSQGFGWQTKADKNTASSQNSASTQDTGTGTGGGGDTGGNPPPDDNTGTYTDEQIQNALRYVVKDVNQTYMIDYPQPQIVLKNGSQKTILVRNLNQPYGLSSDLGINYLFWTSAIDEVVKKYTIATGEVSELTSSFDDPFAIPTTHNGYVYVYLVVDNKLLRYVHSDPNNPAAGSPDEVDAQLIKDFGTAAVHGLAYDTERNMILVSDANGRVSHELSVNDNVVKFLRYSPAI